MIFFAAALLMIVSSCKDDDPVEFPITGVWKPIQMVRNTVANNNTSTTTETFPYSDCEQAGRWIFDENNSGKRMEKALFGTNCVETINKTFNYSYDKKTGKLNLDYVNTSEKGTITNVQESTMNLKIEQTNQTGYVSETYSLVRIQ